MLSPPWGCREVLSQLLVTVGLRCGYGDLQALLARSGETPSHALDLSRPGSGVNTLGYHWCGRPRESQPAIPAPSAPQSGTLRGGAAVLGSNCIKGAGLGKQRGGTGAAGEQVEESTSHAQSLFWKAETPAEPPPSAGLLCTAGWMM